MFLHNPDRCHTDRDELTAALITAFAALKAAACNHVICSYGVATWTSFTEGAFTVTELLDCATHAAGGNTHHLTTIQLPVSLGWGTHRVLRIAITAPAIAEAECD